MFVLIKRMLLIPGMFFDPFKPNGISHSYQLDQLISIYRVVG